MGVEWQEQELEREHMVQELILGRFALPINCPKITTGRCFNNNNNSNHTTGSIRISMRFHQFAVYKATIVTTAAAAVADYIIIIIM